MKVLTHSGRRQTKQHLLSLKRAESGTTSQYLLTSSVSDSGGHWRERRLPGLHLAPIADTPDGPGTSFEGSPGRLSPAVAR